MKRKKSFYPFGFQFTVKTLRKSVYDQLIAGMPFREFFKRQQMIALREIGKYEKKGAFAEPGHYKLIVHSATKSNLYKEQTEETDD